MIIALRCLLSSRTSAVSISINEVDPETWLSLWLILYSGPLHRLVWVNYNSQTIQEFQISFRYGSGSSTSQGLSVIDNIHIVTLFWKGKGFNNMDAGSSVPFDLRERPWGSLKELQPWFLILGPDSALLSCNLLFPVSSAPGFVSDTGLMFMPSLLSLIVGLPATILLGVSQP